MYGDISGIGLKGNYRPVDESSGKVLEYGFEQCAKDCMKLADCHSFVYEMNDKFC